MFAFIAFKNFFFRFKLIERKHETPVYDSKMCMY